jgi:hypothetical protein
MTLHRTMGSPQPLVLAFPRFLSYGWALVPIRQGEKTPDLDLLRDMYGDTRIAHLRHAPALAGEVELWFENEPEGRFVVAGDLVRGGSVSEMRIMLGPPAKKLREGRAAA